MGKLKLNVSRRPFVNEKPLIRFTVVLIVLLVIATFANVLSLFGSLSRHRLVSAREKEDAEVIVATKRATEGLTRGVDPADARRLRGEAVAVTDVIHSRRLSWSKLFDELAVRLPPDVRILSINPDVRESTIMLTMECLAKDHDSKLMFYSRLNEAPFSNARIVADTPGTGQIIRFPIVCRYDPDGSLVMEETPDSGAERSAHATVEASPEGGTKDRLARLSGTATGTER